jgi:hypothetical protein
MEQQQNKPIPLELSPQLVTMMTTEHYNLQTGRSITMAESNGRCTLFVGAVSSGLIALVFVGQSSHLGTSFYVFSLVVIFTLFFMGFITFERVLQAGLDDVIYARGVNRIRHLYREYAPQMQPYFIHWTHGDRYFIPATRDVEEGTFGREAMRSLWGEVFHNTAGMIAVITSVLAGSFVGLLLAAFSLPLWVSTSVGVVTFLLSVTLHQRYQWKWMRLARTIPVFFPDPPGEG